MGIKEAIQDAIKDAMRSKDQERLECLRMAKGALLLKEKEGPKDAALPEEEMVQALRAEVKKRQQSIETFEQLGKREEADRSRREIAVIEGFLPRQLSAEELEGRIRAHLAAHPELNHAGKLTGAVKKELGDLADGKMLNALCQKVLGG